MVNLCVQWKRLELKEDIYISLGSNQGNRIQNLRSAVRAIGYFARVLEKSPVYETPPWGFESNKPFLNAVIKVRSELEPGQLLSELLRIEKDHGRDRSVENQGYADRSLDMDILMFGNRIVHNAHLQIPHPRMNQRKFVLEPLSKISSDLLHPADNKTISDILKTSDDKSDLVETNYAL